MSEAVNHIEPITEGQLQFDPPQILDMLRARGPERERKGWSIASFQDESVAEHRWFGYRNPDGNYVGSIRYMDGVGWRAYEGGKGLVETVDTETNESRPALFGATTDPSEAAEYIEKLAVAAKATNLVENTVKLPEVTTAAEEAANVRGASKVAEVFKFHRQKRFPVIRAIGSISTAAFAAFRLRR